MVPPFKGLKDILEFQSFCEFLLHGRPDIRHYYTSEKQIQQLLQKTLSQADSA